MVVYIKLKDTSCTVYFQSIIGTYSHLAWTRTEDAKEGLIEVIFTHDRIKEVREVLENLNAEIEFDEIEV